jgi:hypothetical protein
MGKILGHPNHPIALDYADSYRVVLGINNDSTMRRRVHEAFLCGIGTVIEGGGLPSGIEIRTDSPGNWWESVFCDAMSCVCMRAAARNRASSCSGGKPCCARAWLMSRTNCHSAVTSFSSAAEARLAATTITKAVTTQSRTHRFFSIIARISEVRLSAKV